MVRLLDKGGLMARGLDEQEKVDETCRSQKSHPDGFAR
jgi:hypothetical protein